MGAVLHMAANGAIAAKDVKPEPRQRAIKSADISGPAVFEMPKKLTKAGRERKRDPERTSAAILAAAVAEFSQRGYEGARVDAIARRAKINKRKNRYGRCGSAVGR